MQSSCLANAILAVREELAVEMANTPELVQEAYRLRHQVYCQENDYEQGVDCLEFDQFDSHSRHVVIQRRSTGRVLGTVRLVLPREGGQDSFPVQRVCDPSLLSGLPLSTTGEVSRFAISKLRREADGPSLALMRLGLIQGAVRLSAEAGHTHWVAIMEPSLLRLLRATGLHFQPIGPLVFYHGWRQPAYADLNVLLDRLAGEKPDLWDFISGSGKYWQREAGAKSLALAA